MQKRILAVAVAAVLCLGAFGAAQVQPLRVRAIKAVTEISGQTTLMGNVVLEVNGVLLRADRAVIKDREVTLEGNVRLTLPERPK